MYGYVTHKRQKLNLGEANYGGCQDSPKLPLSIDVGNQLFAQHYTFQTFRLQ